MKSIVRNFSLALGLSLAILSGARADNTKAVTDPINYCSSLVKDYLNAENDRKAALAEEMKKWSREYSSALLDPSYTPGQKRQMEVAARTCNPIELSTLKSHKISDELSLTNF
ncbi:MAG: hypothetical protein GYA55_01465 [SAR324 cluster bacterium]|uniref:DUF1311 domain-containing protein n=1 Tax=SAR324 cluster bacterium TaxID=2024889 RepID=A0A7X9IKC1_9DELT|nr:hypothetical protein [SAR324 cluster bacterium]